MNTITNIHLNGKSFQLEEAGYKALHQYLDEAKAKLAHDPDADEILTDLEQAIADKCSQRLQGDKNVVTAAEMAKILEEMGQVEAMHEEADNANATDANANTGAGAGATGSGPTNSAPAKRLYRIKDGAVLGGVCKGIAAYFGADVTIVRLLLIFFTLVAGSGLLAYIIAWIVVPKATTPSQIAEAYGRPVTAQDIVERSAGQLAIAAERLRKTDTTKWDRSTNIAVVILIVFAVIIVISAIVNGLSHIFFWPF